MGQGARQAAAAAKTKDPRVKAACVTGWMTEFAALLPGFLRNQWGHAFKLLKK